MMTTERALKSCVSLSSNCERGWNKYVSSPYIVETVSLNWKSVESLSNFELHQHGNGTVNASSAA